MRIQFDDKTNQLWIPRPNAEIEKRLDAEYLRVPGKLRWGVPEGVTLPKFKNLLATLLSGRLEPNDPIVLQRISSCFGPPKCPGLSVEATGSWCKACGCGKTQVANIDGSPSSKLTFRVLKCPRMMPGFSNERPG